MDMLQRFASYAYSMTLKNGTVRALSDDWDPGRAAEFIRARLAR